jgi:hypothetical protein
MNLEALTLDTMIGAKANTFFFEEKLPAALGRIHQRMSVVHSPFQG